MTSNFDSASDSNTPPSITDSEFGDLEYESRQEFLPFTVKIVRTEEQLRKVCSLRAAAYSHHFPELGEKFGQPDSIDRELCTVIFLAEDKATGAPIGTIRIQINMHQKLQVEESAALPFQFSKLRLAEVTRLAVSPASSNDIVKYALIKACYLYCLAMQIRAMVITSRQSMCRWYKMLGFQDVFADNRLISCKHVGGLPHRILFIDVYAAERQWRGSNHKLYEFWFFTYHPDIEVFSAVSSGWSRPRAEDRPTRAPGQWSTGLGAAEPIRLNG